MPRTRDRLPPPIRRFLRVPLLALRHRGLRGDDIVLAEYPKSGGTWLAFMLGEILFRREMDFISQEHYLPGVGVHSRSPRASDHIGRLIRTHESYRDDYPRAIYLVRHVADVAVSYYHWLRWQNVAPPDFNRVLGDLLAGRLNSYGPWQDHVSQWITAPIPIHVIRYEDLRSSTEHTLRQAIDFLGAQADDDALREAISNNSLSAMRAKEKAARDMVLEGRNERLSFVRKGQIGESATMLSELDWNLVERLAGATLVRLGYPVRT